MHQRHVSCARLSDILPQGSKTIARRAAEDQALSEARAEARRARSERRSRGHASVPRRGEDPGHDLLEKGLGKLATKWVVCIERACHVQFCMRP